MSGHTAQEVLGFSKSLAVNADVNTFLAALNKAGEERGIRLDAPSDALDMSRDIMLDEAAAALGVEWEIHENTLRLWPRDVVINWETIS